MQNSQWKRVEELFHGALELKPEERDQYLVRECRDNSGLKDEVLSLLSEVEFEKTLFENQAVSLGLRVISNETKGTLLGQVIGHYKLLRLLGSGGMGEVYLAEDLTLERQVALKFLASGFGNDSWAKAQLKREARAVAKLENPNICAIHRIEEVDGYNFIEMQYIEGQTLQALLRTEELDLDRALAFAEQIANALAAAHLRGIVHRDIKTQNIIVTPLDQVKVLDFGLAKLTVPANFAMDRSQDEHTSLVGHVMGTIAYMSPEQTRGEELGSESDVFSFGIVLNELVDGKNPFLGDTREQTISAIQNHDPTLNQALPNEVQEIIKKCLAKKREDRFENADEIRSEILALIKSRQPKEVPWWLNQRRLKYYAVAASILLVALIAASGFVYRKVSNVQKLALIQIRNDSGDANLNYLSQGLTRNLFDKFNYLPRLKVKLPSEVPSTPDKSVDTVKAGKDLGVDAVLTGQLFKQDNSVMLRVRLSKAKDGSALWEQTFDTSSKNVFALQDEITAKVVSSLGMWLVGSERTRLGRHQTDNEEALREYMFGRQNWNARKLTEAVTYFEKARTLDPAFAEAYSGLSDCYSLLNSVAFGGLSSDEAMSKARWNAEQALALNESLAEAHVSVGVVAFRYDWNWQSAEQEFRRSIQIDPNYGPAYQWYSLLLSGLGRYDEALQLGDLSRQLDPYSSTARMNYGRALYYLRRFDEAQAYFDSLVLEKPDQPQFLHMQGLVQIQRGRYGEAIATLEKLYDLRPTFSAAVLGFSYGKNREREKAENMLAWLESNVSNPTQKPLEKALVNIGLGNKDEAFKQLNLALIARSGSLPLINADPLYDDLRSDPRFSELTGKIGLPKR